MKEDIGNGQVLKKKRGRKRSVGKEVYRPDRSQRRFYIDLKDDDEVHSELMDTLTMVNEKDYGSPIGIKEVFLFAFRKLNSKDLEKIRDSSLTAAEKLEMARVEFNEKNGTDYSLEEFLLRRLNIQ